MVIHTHLKEPWIQSRSKDLDHPRHKKTYLEPPYEEPEARLCGGRGETNRDYSDTAHATRFDCHLRVSVAPRSQHGASVPRRHTRGIEARTQVPPLVNPGDANPDPTSSFHYHLKHSCGRPHTRSGSDRTVSTPRTWHKGYNTFGTRKRDRVTHVDRAILLSHDLGHESLAPLRDGAMKRPFSLILIEE
ncbi:hypothetical protein BHM03_00042228 [Ensete ventricosum]|nr:hypothetical protein BHM03_00042228 [Ensete ventricosum]